MVPFRAKLKLDLLTWIKTYISFKPCVSVFLLIKIGHKETRSQKNKIKVLLGSSFIRPPLKFYMPIIIIFQLINKTVNSIFYKVLPVS